MGNVMIALFLAAGLSGLAYTKLGKRVGYGNSASVWKLVAITFVLSFAVVFILLKTLITLN